MRHKALFKFVVKVCGLLLALIGLMMLLMQGIELVYRLATERMSISYYQIKDVLYATPFVVLGVYLMFWGNWIADKAFPAGPKCCPACGYQVRGNISGVCSECGSVLPPEFKNHE